MRFTAYGHKNLRGTHRNTFEFTKDKDLTVEGDCIIGIRADFDISELKALLRFDKLKIRMKVEDMVEEAVCETNKDFSDGQEIVFRRSDFNSSRTLGIKADRACIDFSRDFIDKLKDDNQKIYVEIDGIEL